jgi:hypothetical protein
VKRRPGRAAGRDECRQYLEDIASESERQIDLVHNLLDLSRVAAGGVEMNSGRADVGEALRDCEKIVRTAAAERDQQLAVVSNILGRVERTNPEADTVLHAGATLIAAGDRRTINALKRLLLLFYLGLESNVARLIEAGRSILLGGSIYIGINFTAGLLYAHLAGFPLRETLVMAGVTTISSSAIVAKVLFDCRRTANPETELILGITMFEDVFLAVYLSLISGVVLSGATSAAGVLTSGGIALGFIVGLMVAGRWATPLLDRLFRISSNEVFVVVVFASLFLLAGLGETIHVAESIGALLLGLILASAAPLLAKESERIYDLAARLLKRRGLAAGEELDEVRG